MTLKPTSFALALKRGLGRALVHLESNHDEETQQTVWQALLNCQRHDLQVEGLGSWYLLEAARRAGLLKDLRPRLIEVLDEGDSWDNIQRMDLLGALGRQGDPLATEHLQHLLVQDLQGEGEQITWLIHALVEAQGPEGLRFALSKLGQTAQQGHPSAHRHFTLQEARFLLGDDVERMIKAWAIIDPFIQQHLEDWHVDQQNQKSKRRVDASYENIQKTVENNRGGLFLLAHHASPETLQRLAGDVLQEKDPSRLERLLLIFQRQPFPLGPLPLLDLASHEDEEVRYRAQRTLRAFQHPEVRALALELLQTLKTASLGVGLLKKNFLPEDTPLLQEVLLQRVEQGDEDELWSFLDELHGVACANPTPELLDLMASAFEHQPCSHCRHEMVVLLKQHHLLPLWLEAEAKLDLSDDLRKEFSFDCGAST